MKRISTLLAAALCLAALAPAKAADSLTMADFAYTNKLVVAGYTGSETLVNFPVLVRIAEYDESTGTGIEGFRYANLTNSKGKDIAFFDELGNHLASEIQTNDWTTSGTSLVWVKLPTMTQGTKFYMCYNTSASGAWVTNENPWGDYVGVWHMDETGTTGKTIYDSTTNGLHGLTYAGSSNGSGAIGKARKIAGDNNHAWGIVVDVLSDTTKKDKAESLGSDFHASFWMLSQASVVDQSNSKNNIKWGNLLGRRKGDQGYSWGVQFGGDNVAGKTVDYMRILSDNDTLNNGANLNCTTNPIGSVLKQNDGVWKKVDVVWKYESNGNVPVVDIYTNGVFVESITANPPVRQEDANIGIGGSTQENPQNKTGYKGRRFNGSMDEVRLHKSVVGSDWVKADYDTVNNPAFVTVYREPATVAWANASGSTPGLDGIGRDSAVVAGTVEDCGDAASCAIQGKFWADGASEPENWTTLTNGLVALDAFRVVVPNLTSETTYHYKLRGEGDDGTPTATVSGTFETTAGLAVSWSAASGSAGLSRIGHDFAVASGEVTRLGAATACEIQGKFWADGDSEPENWTTLTNGLATGDAFAVSVGSLTPETTYNYALRAVGNDDPASETTPVAGSFTTAPGLTVAWSTATSSTGIASLGYGFVSVGGQVTALGDASYCSIQSKIWIAGGTEPDGWTTIKDRLGLNGTFAVNVPDLAAGTTYRYELRAVGDDGEETVPVSGSFTTPGSSGEEIGSEWTHFFDDGTNACWVANDFERYLPFTVTGYSGTETLTNFPVLVDVRKADDNGFSYDDFYHYDGADIAFVDERGHIIPHEIDTWNKNGQSLIWVRLPEMVNGTTFTMCYRSPLLETPPDPGCVFERYVGVWHMAEPGDGVVSLKDSGPYGFETETHAASLDSGLSGGRIGRARRVAQQNGSAGSYGRIIAFDHDDILRTGVGNVFTYSGWYKLLQNAPKWAYLVGRKSEDADIGWGVQYDDTSTSQLRVWPAVGAKSGFQKFDTTGSGGNNTWNYWTFVFDGSVNPDGTTNRLFHAYLNGEELASTKGGFRLNYPIVNDERAAFDHLCVVGQQNGTGAFNGLADECRYSKGIRSDDWIKAEYDSTLQQAYWNDPARRFVTKGTVSRGADSLVPVVVWERGKGLPDTVLDVSYAYVQFAGTVTYCGAGASTCRIEYQIWPGGEDRPAEWDMLRGGLRAGDSFSVPVTGLKQDMLYNFCIRAANDVYESHEHAGQFRTTGNMTLENYEGELFRIGDRFVHRYAEAGNWRFTTPDYATNVEILVVGGGGAGGYKVGGGGGGGGLFYSESFPVATSTTYRVYVGKGGVAPTNVTTDSEEGSGEQSYFALETEDELPPLIKAPGGGGGGSWSTTAESVSAGAPGGSGGGGTYGQLGGEPVTNMIVQGEAARTVGHRGGRGNDKLNGGVTGKNAAGGGGGAGREATDATRDQRSTGGSGGVGVAISMTGETLYYGAGGGGGYIYNVDAADAASYTRPGTGGSGIGGDAANVREGTPATSGVPNTGAGGGGGSSFGNPANINNLTPGNDSTYWQGGNGGDGVVLIAYEAHGRDPIAEEPRISMTSCDYTDEKGYADIAYRAYWAGVQAFTDDIYVLYGTTSSNDVAAGIGERVKVAVDTIGIGATTFAPPEVGYTYWVRLMARKDANSYMYSDEIGEFEVPALRNNGATWHMDAEEDPSTDFATIFYNLYYMAEGAHLYCYWSESREDLEGDAAPSGAGVRFLDLGTGRQGATTFTIPSSEGLERNKTYYTRLATGNEAGTKYFLSKRVMVLDTVDRPRVIFDEATWANHVATIRLLETTAALDPATVDLVAYYGTLKDVYGDNGDIKKINQAFGPDARSVNLGSCALYPDDIATTTQFPLWSAVDTNYYVRLALVSNTNGALLCASQRCQYLNLVSAVPANTLLVYANATPKVGCYGDEPQALDYTVSYGGRTEGPGWDNWTNAMSFANAPTCAVTSASATGQYGIEQGDFALSPQGPYIRNEPVLDPETGEPVLDDLGYPVTEPVYYYYMLCWAGSQYAVTNAQLSVAVADVSFPYTGGPCDPSGLVVTTNGLRNAQPISYQYRLGTNEWTAAMPTGFTDVGTQTVQFKASAPNHDGCTGFFTVTIEPAALVATISAADLNYDGSAQVPAVATNVAGLVRGDLNAVTCEFRDEAGEWQAAVPAFEQPGAYRLFFRASAPNHAAAVAECTFRIVGWDFRVNLDGQSGYPTELLVSDPGWLLERSGCTGTEFADAATRYAKLDETCANGLKLWQNYVIDRGDLDRKLVAAVRQSGDRVRENCFVVHFPGVEPLPNTGFEVNYRLDRRLRGEGAFTPGELGDKYETNVPLAPGDPTGLYAFNIVLTNGTGQAVLPSVATVGVLRVTSPATNTVLAVPWMSMDTETAENEPIEVSETVNPNGLSDGTRDGDDDGDRILAYDAATGLFRSWSHLTGTSWSSAKTVTKSGISSSDADTTTFARGTAFWLVRNDPGGGGSTNHVYLVGRYTGDGYTVALNGGTTDAPGYTLVANPTMDDVGLNDLEFVGGSPAAGDRIVVQDAAGFQRVYVRRNGAWGRWVSRKVGGRVKQTWETGGSVPSGTGFWYVRTADAPLSIRFGGAQ